MTTSPVLEVHLTRRYGTARVRAWHRLHPRIWRRSAWDDRQGQLPIVEGTLPA